MMPVGAAAQRGRRMAAVRWIRKCPPNTSTNTPNPSSNHRGGTFSRTKAPANSPTNRNGKSGTNSAFHTSARSFRPMLKALTQSSNTTMGMANLSGIKCASNGTAISGGTLTTDANGFFSFYGCGRYSLLVSGPGITSYQIDDVDLGGVLAQYAVPVILLPAGNWTSTTGAMQMTPAVAQTFTASATTGSVTVTAGGATFAGTTEIGRAHV